MGTTEQFIKASASETDKWFFSLSCFVEPDFLNTIKEASEADNQQEVSRLLSEITPPSALTDLLRHYESSLTAGDMRQIPIRVKILVEDLSGEEAAKIPDYILKTVQALGFSGLGSQDILTKNPKDSVVFSNSEATIGALKSIGCEVIDIRKHDLVETARAILKFKSDAEFKRRKKAFAFNLKPRLSDIFGFVADGVFWVLKRTVLRDSNTPVSQSLDKSSQIQGTPPPESG